MVRTVTVLVLLFPQQKNEAEELYTQMQDKLRGAKTARFTFKSTIENPDEKWEGTAWIAEGNKARVEISRQRAQNPYSLTLICDGKQIFWGSPTRKAMEKAPDTFIADLVGLFAKMGANEDRLEDLFRGRRDKVERFESTDFAMGAREKLGDREAQEIRFTVKVKGRDGGADVKLWLDAETRLPLKRVMAVKERPDEVVKEEYAGWKLGESVEASKFDIPKE